MTALTSFITGSRAYGTPREDSDTDLAILADACDTAQLWKLSECPKSVRYGSLNLLVFQDRQRFEQWRDVTIRLAERAPVTREEAVRAFQSAGFSNPYEVEVQK